MSRTIFPPKAEPRHIVAGQSTTTPALIGWVKNYRENRILSIGQIVAGKFRPKKNVRGH
jgi:hypothetical protein